MNVGQVVEVKLLDRPPSKGLGSELCAAVAVAAVEDVAEVSAWPELLFEPEPSPSGAVLLGVDVDIVIANVVVTVLWTGALLQSPFTSGSTIVHTPCSRRAGICESSNSVSPRSGAAVGSGSSSSSSRRGDASVCEAEDTARHKRAAAHCIRGLW